MCTGLNISLPPLRVDYGVVAFSTVSLCFDFSLLFFSSLGFFLFSWFLFIRIHAHIYLYSMTCLPDSSRLSLLSFSLSLFLCWPVSCYCNAYRLGHFPSFQTNPMTAKSSAQFRLFSVFHLEMQRQTTTTVTKRFKPTFFFHRLLLLWVPLLKSVGVVG